MLLFGSYVQAVAGFALGMIAVAIIGGLRLLDIPTLAAMVSFLSMLNAGLSLQGSSHHVHRSLLFWLGVGILPGLLLGYWLMLYLNGSALWLLELCLGLFITVGGLSMSIRPRSWPQRSGAPFTWSGLIGGVLGGLFCASGPLLGWFAYSQPLSVAVIRATLLSYFFLTTSARTVIVFFDGSLTASVLLYAGLGAPVVILGAWLGRRFPPVVSEPTLKRGCLCCCLFMGVWICFSAIGKGLMEVEVTMKLCERRSVRQLLLLKMLASFFDTERECIQIDLVMGKARTLEFFLCEIQQPKSCCEM